MSCFLMVCLCLILSACATKGKIDKTSIADEDSRQALVSQYQDAVETMKSLESSSDQAMAAGVFKGNDELEDSFHTLAEIHQQNPWYPGPLLNLGISSWWLGNVEEAESYLSKVLALKDSLGQENKQKADNKASIDLPTDKRAEILDNLAKFTGPALNYLGQIMREKGDFDQAESYYRQALDQNPEDITAIRNMGILLDLYRGQFADALPLYEQYQSLLDEPDPQVKDWIFDIKNRQ